MTNQDSTPIAIAYPEAPDLHLRLSVGACRVRLLPGQGDQWVVGAYHDPTGALPCRVTQDGGTLHITQGANVAHLTGLVSGAPRFALELGTTRPFALTLEAGAADTDLDLGGVPLNRLTLRLGAAANILDFTAPNPHPMSQLTISAGAGSISARQLGHANCAEIIVEGGAASYTLDFGGPLHRDMTGRINAGIAAVEVDVPATTAARIAPESVLGSLSIGDGFTKHHGAFWTPAALTGGQPALSLQLTVTLGSVTLALRPS
ncbi:MAG: hypothetical protein IT340_12795 [Chloroflexi bacterium]|nr:hypothetical protein [Chloroflexota bacterium]